MGVDLTGKRADDLAHEATLDQEGESDFAVSGVVIDDREVGGAMANEPINELDGLAGLTESANHDGRPIADIG